MRSSQSNTSITKEQSVQAELENFIAYAEELKHRVFHVGFTSYTGKEFDIPAAQIISAANQLNQRLYDGLQALYSKELSPSFKPGLFTINKALHENKLKLARLLMSVLQKEIVTIPQAIFLCKLIEDCKYFNLKIDPSASRFGALLNEITREIADIKGLVNDLFEDVDRYSEAQLKLIDYTADRDIELDKHPVITSKHDVIDKIEDVYSVRADQLYYPDAIFTLEEVRDVKTKRLFQVGPKSGNVESYQMMRIELELLKQMMRDIHENDLLLVDSHKKIALLACHERVRRFLDKLESSTKKLLLDVIAEDKRKQKDIKNRSLVSIDGVEDVRNAYYRSQDKSSNPFLISMLENDIKMELERACTPESFIKSIRSMLDEYQSKIYVTVEIDYESTDENTKRLEWATAMSEANPNIEHGQLDLFRQWRDRFAGMARTLTADLKYIDTYAEVLSGACSPEGVNLSRDDLNELTKNAVCVLANMSMLESMQSKSVPKPHI